MAELPITEESYPLMYQLRQVHQDRTIVFVALEQLEEQAAIEQFYAEYVQYLKDSGATDEEAVSLAGANIGYAKHYYTKTVWSRWVEALPGVVHPVFGT